MLKRGNQRGVWEVRIMLIREAMTTPAVTVTTQSSIETAARLMRDEQLGSIPVVDARGVLVGVISRTNVRVADPTPADAASDVAGQHDVGDTMRHRAVTVGPDDEIQLALDRMCTGTVDSLPVVDGRRVVGTVSRDDLVGLLPLPRRTFEVESSAGMARDADGVQAAPPSLAPELVAP
jgi:CBS domain-containing protein